MGLNQIIEDPKTRASDIQAVIGHIEDEFADKDSHLVEIVVPSMSTPKFDGYNKVYIDDFHKYRTSEYEVLVHTNSRIDKQIQITVSNRKTEYTKAYLNIFRLPYQALLYSLGLSLSVLC